MGIGEDFKTFCGTLVIANRDTIAARGGSITRRLNLDFWNSDSRDDHSLYTGSYGRGTAIGTSSDVDLIMKLPWSIHEQFGSHSGNGQSALLQTVRASIKKTYSITDVGADGQVVQVPFDDGLVFEVVPAFEYSDGSFKFPNANSGGSWKTTNPRPEIQAIADLDVACNYNLKWLCRMARAWKRQWDVPIGGLLIDTLACQFIRNWNYRDKAFLYYDWMSRDYFAYLAAQDESKLYWIAPGSGQYVWKTGNFQYKATRCKNIAIEAIDYASRDMHWSARKAWRSIYGTGYPS